MRIILVFIGVAVGGRISILDVNTVKYIKSPQKLINNTRKYFKFVLKYKVFKLKYQVFGLFFKEKKY